MKNNWRNRALLLLCAALLFNCKKEKNPSPAKNKGVRFSAELNNLLKPTDAAIVSSIKTIVPIEATAAGILKVKGRISYDTRGISALPIRFSGRVEEIYVTFNFQPVRKGQRILDIYSPELVTAQKELIFLLEKDPGNSSLIEAARNKLILLGLTTDQISGITNEKKEIYSLSVLSPFDGYITDGNGANELTVRAGKYVSAGESLFDIINPGKVWAEFDLPQSQAAGVSRKTIVEISSDNTASPRITANVDQIVPFLRSGEEFITLRIYVDNRKGAFNIGQLVTGVIASGTAKQLWVPASSVVDLGNEKVVFVKRRGIFRASPIETGIHSSDQFQLVGGIEAGDSIAAQGQYLVDSESFVKITNRK